ncbi:hypothetical protein EI74_0743 [Mycoplasma testudineum]|uniref:Uncharacterized protein n=1 Tax=Mycoplasma testudineum TaxID=244584 RepID=A0A4R6ICY3_9MOLU|nr:hypothetical protein [Mycoplasma testudineum]TDO19471.1 hypothetical protein EI74_0743 [Mycoplasma testudineum]
MKNRLLYRWDNFKHQLHPPSYSSWKGIVFESINRIYKSVGYYVTLIIAFLALFALTFFLYCWINHK